MIYSPAIHRLLPPPSQTPRKFLYFPSVSIKYLKFLSANLLNINLHFSRKSRLYRYSFNGKESDSEASDLGEGTQDYGFRIYNPSLGKFLSVDPLYQAYPMLTPYQFASNTPVQSIDMDGLEAVKIVDQSTKTTTILINVVYVPNTTEDPQYGSGFNRKEILEIESGINSEIEKTVFCDNENKDSDGSSFDVSIRVNFIEAATLEEARNILAQKDNRAVMLKFGGVELFDEGTRAKVASTKIGEVRMTSSVDSHANTHELFHSIIHFSKKTPWSWLSYLNDSNQAQWHKDFGGIFLYNQNSPITQENINQALKVTPTFFLSPMGPYTPEELEYLGISQ